MKILIKTYAYHVIPHAMNALDRIITIVKIVLIPSALLARAINAVFAFKILISVKYVNLMPSVKLVMQLIIELSTQQIMFATV
jgi:hypothetical protein